MGRRAQISMEYILIMAFAFAMTLPLFGIFHKQTMDMQDTIIDAQIEKAARTIADAADAVYYYGEPAKRTVRVYFPSDVKSIDIQEDNIIFLISSVHGDYEWAVASDAPLAPLISNGGESRMRVYEGIHVVEVTATSNNDVKIFD